MYNLKTEVHTSNVDFSTESPQTHLPPDSKLLLTSLDLPRRDSETKVRPHQQLVYATQISIRDLYIMHASPVSGKVTPLIVNKLPSSTTSAALRLTFEQFGDVIDASGGAQIKDIKKFYNFREHRSKFDDIRVRSPLLDCKLLSEAHWIYLLQGS
ncbi:hypothetical protein BJ508DRAFT_323056 [Ascobolus immersus RN42]|uniref:RRM domain-containing protein n=1 Tax=Ascobolus immersus RN42 TaxID=1160509 RepID=A0A3N4IFE4_ASCIM|nr:hypothetical protein BJ508DRAFT_323056 [Ascobolus immersus RN42]